MERNKKEAGDVKISMAKIGKRRILERNKKESEESECDGVENVSEQSRGGKVRQSQEHLGSSSEWDREVTPGVLLRNATHPNTGEEQAAETRQREQSRIWVKQQHFHGQTRHGSGKRLRYKGQIKEGNIHGCSSTRLC